ncbi:MAG TPA: FtsQ-type POTRA domain-containing protein [Streptosporangiaceae bacterium]|nr:FtsQ-type POTRA domain-containing protein [Streptosporangiaceae bacterium]
MRARAHSLHGRHDRWKAAFFGLAATALVGGVAWALLGSSFLVVRSVRTTGSAVPRARVLGAAGIRPGTPLIRVDTGAVARRVERIRQVQEARVTRSWPDAIVIWTKQRTAVFAVPAQHGYRLMDSYGVILGQAAVAPAGLVVLSTPARPAGTLRSDPAVLAAGSVVRTLPRWLRQRVARARAPGPADVILILRDGTSVAWGGPGRAAQKAAELAILLRTGARSYDVSDPGTAVTGSSGSQASHQSLGRARPPRAG